MIDIDGVSKNFHTNGQELPVLDTVNLRVEAGTFLSLVGPSGCGKSTLLNLISGFLQPTTGTIRINGRRVTRIDGNLGVGYVTQDNKLFPWLTLQGNLEFPLRMQGWSADARRARVSELLELVGLAGFEDRYIYQLSGGMQKRAALAQALSYDPDVLLMDEPFGMLDAQTRMLLQQELLDIWHSTGKTIVFVTHDLQEAIALSDQVLVMSQRPTRIKATVQVTIPRPREVFRIHRSPGFDEHYQAVWDVLREELTLPRRVGKEAGPVATSDFDPTPNALNSSIGGTVGNRVRTMD